MRMRNRIGGKIPVVTQSAPALESYNMGYDGQVPVGINYLGVPIPAGTYRVRIDATRGSSNHTGDEYFTFGWPSSPSNVSYAGRRCVLPAGGVVGSVFKSDFVVTTKREAQVYAQVVQSYANWRVWNLYISLERMS